MRAVNLLVRIDWLVYGGNFDTANVMCIIRLNFVGKGAEPSVGARSSLTRPSDLGIGRNAFFAGDRMDPIAWRLGRLNCDI